MDEIGTTAREPRGHPLDDHRSAPSPVRPRSLLSLCQTIPTLNRPKAAFGRPGRAFPAASREPSLRPGSAGPGSRGLCARHASPANRAAGCTSGRPVMETAPHQNQTSPSGGQSFNCSLYRLSCQRPVRGQAYCGFGRAVEAAQGDGSSDGATWLHRSPATFSHYGRAGNSYRTTLIGGTGTPSRASSKGSSWTTTSGGRPGSL